MAGKEWMTRTPQPIAERKEKRKLWKTQWEIAAQANKEALTLLIKPASPILSQTLTPKSFHRGTE